MQIKRKAARGAQIVQTLGLILITLMVSALAIDYGFYFAAQNQLQTTADAAALAATTELYDNNDLSDPEDRQERAMEVARDVVAENQSEMVIEDGDIQFGYINPDSKVYDPASFSDPSADPDYDFTGGYNAVRVAVRRSSDSPNGPLSTIMANMFGVTSMDAAATSIALIDNNIGTIEDGGVRPIYACEAQFELAMADGNPTNNVIRVYGDHMEVDGVGEIAGCPEPGPGNWGFADLRDCSSGSVGTSTFGDWMMNGYPGAVSPGECYSTKTGNPIASGHVANALDHLISNQTSVLIPLYDSWNGSGSNTSVNVSSFAGFVITGYEDHGPAHDRYIEGYFTKAYCKTGCETGPNDNDSPGGGLVKIRLAAKS